MAGSRVKGITINIDGDKTGLDKALKEVNSRLFETKDALRDVNRLLKLDPKNTQLMEQKQKLLAQSVDDTKEKLKKLKEAEKEVSEELQNDDKGKAQYEALQREIVETEQKLKSLEKEQKQYNSVAGVKLQETGKKVEEVGTKMQSAGKTLTMGVTAPIVGLGAAAVKTAADFDSQMSKVQAISGATGSDMEKLRAKAREMGAETKFSAKESGEAMEYMAMAGWKTTDMVDGLKGIMDLAAASGEELGTTSDIVTDGLTAFGMTAKDSSHFADVLAAASSNANTNVSMMGESFKYVAPVAGSMGYSVEDVSTALGLMANSGIKASNAGTALRTLLTNMANPTDTMAAAMEDLGISLDDGHGHMKSLGEIMGDLRKGFGQLKVPQAEAEASMKKLNQQLADGEITEKQYTKMMGEWTRKCYGAEGALKAQAAAQLAGKTGMAGLLAVVNSSESDYEKLTGAINTASDTMVKTSDGSVMSLNEALSEGKEVVEEYNGAAEAMNHVMQDNLSGRFENLKSEAAELAISIGEQIIPVVEDVLSTVRKIVGWFNNLSDGQKQLLIKIAGIVAAIGPLLLAGGSVVRGVGSIMQVGGRLMTFISGAGGLIPAIGSVAAAAGPFLIGGAIIAGIIAAVILIIKNWGKIKKFLLDLCEKIGSVVTKTFQGMKEVITAVTDAIKKVIETAWKAIKKVIEVIIKGIKIFIKREWDGIKVIVTTVVKAIKTVVSTVFKGIKTAISTVINGIKNIVKAGFNFIKNKIIDPIKYARHVIKELFGKIKEAISSRVDAIKEKISNVFGKVKEIMTKPFTKAKETISNIIGKIKGLFNFKWSLPKPKLPHFKWEWKEVADGLLKLPKFRIEWYKKAMDTAMILKGATVFGEKDGKLLGGGEAGDEVVAGAGTLMDMIRRAVASVMSIQKNATNALQSSIETKNINITYGDVNMEIKGAPGQDVRELAKIVNRDLKNAYDREKAVWA